jgi:hypothetical protein
MIKLTGLDGSTILVAAGAIFRLRATVPSEGAAAVEVEHSGGYVLTFEALAALVARLYNVGKLIQLTTRSGISGYLKTAAISRVRAAPPINGPGTEIVVGGHCQQMIEPVAVVESAIAAAAG